MPDLNALPHFTLSSIYSARTACPQENWFSVPFRLSLLILSTDLLSGAKIPGDAYCVRIKITHDEEGNDWNYLKIYILLKPES